MSGASVFPTWSLARLRAVWYLHFDAVISSPRKVPNFIDVGSASCGILRLSKLDIRFRRPLVRNRSDDISNVADSLQVFNLRILAGTFLEEASSETTINETKHRRSRIPAQVRFSALPFSRSTSGPNHQTGRLFPNPQYRRTIAQHVRSAART